MARGSIQLCNVGIPSFSRQPHCERMEDLSLALLPVCHCYRFPVVLLSRAHFYCPFLFYLDLLDCTQKRYCQSAFRHADGTGPESHHFRLEPSGVQYESPPISILGSRQRFRGLRNFLLGCRSCPLLHEHMVYCLPTNDDGGRLRSNRGRL